jgi:hypothetical protein
MLNPSAAAGLPANYPVQNYGRLFDHTRATGVGIIGIRVRWAPSWSAWQRLNSSRMRSPRSKKAGERLPQRCQPVQRGGGKPRNRQPTGVNAQWTAERVKARPVSLTAVKHILSRISWWAIL